MVQKNFIDSLPVETADKEFLRTLSADSPAALLGYIRASRDFFEQRFGPKKLDQITSLLGQMLSVHEHAVLKGSKKEFAMGAVVDLPAPELNPPRFDIRKRDALFRELTELEQQDQTPEVKTRIEQLTNSLNELLDQHS
jgi:hypothetical protein